MSERHHALPQAPVLDRPDRPAILTKPDDRRFRHQQGLRELHRRDVDLGLLAKMEVSRQSDRKRSATRRSSLTRSLSGSMRATCPTIPLAGCDRRTISAGLPTLISPALLSSI